MAATMDDVRIDEKWCNMYLSDLGVDTRIHITRHRDGGRGSYRLEKVGTCEPIGGRMTKNELAKALEVLVQVLGDVTR